MALGYIRAQLLRNSRGFLMVISCSKPTYDTDWLDCFVNDEVTKANLSADSNIKSGGTGDQERAIYGGRVLVF